MDKMYKEEKRVFEKHKQKIYKHEKEFIYFFKISVLAKKKAPAGRRTAKKNKFLKNISKGHKKGLRKRNRNKMVMDGLSIGLGKIL